MDVICGTRDSVVLIGNKLPNGSFVFSGPLSAFKDRGNGTAVIYPKLLSEGLYSVTMHYDYKDSHGNIICSTEKTKAFSIAKIADIDNISLFCEDGYNAVRLHDTEIGVTYELQVNGVTFETKAGTGGNLDFSKMQVQNAYVKVYAREGNCVIKVSKEFSVSTLKLSTTKTDITCHGANDGTMVSTVTGGGAPYSYTFERTDGTMIPINDRTATGLSAGFYMFTVQDTIGCERTSTIEITEPDSLLVSITTIPIKCSGENKATVSAHTEGGRTPYEYVWTKLPSTIVGTTATVSGLGNGDYQVQVSDKSLCTAKATTTISSPDPLKVSLVSKQDVLLTGHATGSITMHVEGGTSPYYYFWTGIGIDPTKATELNQTDLLAGNYYLTVTDSLGCKKDTLIVITEPAAISVTAHVKNISCFNYDDGYIQLDVTGGVKPYTYVWSTTNGFSSSDEDIQNLAPNDYTITITDNEGNAYSNMYRVTQPDTLLVRTLLSKITHVPCYGDKTGNIDIEVEGGTSPYVVQWTGSDIPTVVANPYSVPNLGAGVYQVKVTDANYCEARLSDEIIQPTLLTLTDSVANNICYNETDGSITILPQGGTLPYSYYWTGIGVVSFAQNQTGLQGGQTYSVTVADSNYCEVKKSFTLLNSTEIVLSTTKTDISCFGQNDGQAKVSVTGGVYPYTFEWRRSDSTLVVKDSIASGLSQGTYTVTVTDALGCVKTRSVTINENNTLTVTISKNDILCSGGDNGSASAMASGGKAPYSYIWTKLPSTSPISHSAAIGNLEAGTYKVELRDNNGCYASATTTIITSTPINVQVTKQDVLVTGQATGAISLTVTGGVPPYTFSWAGPSINPSNQDDQNLTDILAGDYHVYITDANNCSIDTVVSVLQPEVIAVQANIKDVSCFGEANGYIELTVTGGTTPYTYSWTSTNGFTSSSEDITGLMADSYTVDIWDAAGNNYSKTFEVQEPNALVINELVSSEKTVPCYGDKMGKLDIEVLGGNKPYTITWSGPDIPSVVANPLSVEDLGAGTYQVFVRDNKGCTQNSSHIITQPNKLLVSAVVTDNVCYNDANGSVVLTVQDGVPPYSYLWSGNGVQPNDQNQYNLVGGKTYVVTVFDDNKCEVNKSFELKQPTEILLSAVTTNISCLGANDGQLEALISGGSYPYKSVWTKNDGTVEVHDSLATGLPPGDYTFTVNDSIGCIKSVEAKVTEPSKLEASIDATAVLCSGVDDGVLQARVTGGTLPYSYLWTLLPSTPIGVGSRLTNLAAGTYKLMVQDKNMCSDDAYATILSSTPLVITLVNKQDVLVTGDNSGSIELAVSGGTLPYNYFWTGTGIDPTKQNDLNQYNLVAGNYTFTVVDNLGCSKDTTIVITQPEVISVVARTQQIDCFGNKNGYVELTVTGGYAPYTYTWTSANGFTSTSRDIYNLNPGNYSLKIEDSQGNTHFENYTITEPSALVLNLLNSSKTALNCFGEQDGNLNIELQGGKTPYSIVWNGQDVPAVVTNPYSLSNLGVGTYTVNVTDKNGCVIGLSQEITQPDELKMTATIVQNVCYNDQKGAIDVTVTGGVNPYVYSWSGVGVVNANEDQSGLRGGRTYQLRFTDNNLCEIDTAFYLKQPEQLVSTIDAAKDICEGDSVSLYFSCTGDPNWSYSYTDGIDIFSHISSVPNFSLKYAPTVSSQYDLISVVDGNGCKALLEGTAPVTVHKYPQLNVLSTTSDCCLGDEILVDMVLANEFPWQVRYTDGTSVFVETGLNKSRDSIYITPTKIGTTDYSIETLSNQYCKTQVDYDFSVTAYEYPNLIVTAPPFVCHDDTVRITLQPIGVGPWQVIYYENGVKYFLDITESPYILKRTPNLVNNVYLFESISSGLHCYAALGKTLQVTVGQLPSDATQIQGNTAVCRNSIERYVVPPITNADSYEWILPAGYTIISGTGSNEIMVQVGQNAEEGLIEVYGVNSCGNGLKSSIYVRPNELLGTVGDISAPLFICENASLFQLSVPEIEGATSYEWTLPTGYTIEAGKNSRTILVSINAYAQSGTVSVVGVNRCTKTDIRTAFLNIRTLPIVEAGVDFTTNCVDYANLKGNNLAGTISKWTLLSGRADFDDITKYNTKVSNLMFGKNKFQWNINDGYCLNFDTVTVTNNNPGITAPEISSIIICEDSITLRAPKPDFGSYRWTLIGGDGIVANPESNSTLVTELGYKITNTFRWEVYTPSCSNTVDVKVISNSLHKLADAGEDDFTVEDYYRLSARINSDSNITGQWSLVAGTGKFDNPNSYNTYVRGLSTGVNTFRWTIQGYGCSAYDEVQIRYAEEPIADFSMDVDSGCSPLTVEFTNLTIGDATYLWNFGDGSTSTQRSPDHTFTRSGVYTVTLTATGSKKTDQITKTVEVFQSPKASFLIATTQLYMPSPEAHFYCETKDVSKYWWNFGDGCSSIERDPVHTYTAEGVYNVTLKVEDAMGCQDSVTIYNAINIGDYGFIVFPNAFTPNTSVPNGGSYTIDERRLDIFYPVSKNVDEYKLQIFNQWGAKIFVSNDVLVGWDGYIDDECALQGTYVYKATGKYKNGREFKVSGSFMLVR